MTKAMTEGHELTDPEITALLAVAGSWKTVEDASTGLVWLPIQNELGKDTSFSRLLTQALQHWGTFAPVTARRRRNGRRQHQYQNHHAHSAHRSLATAAPATPLQPAGSVTLRVGIKDTSPKN